MVIMRDEQAVTTSLQVADNFEKNHRDVLRTIEALEKDVRNFAQMFLVGNEPDSYGRDRKIYYITRDGFALLAMGFTGQKALQFKLEYIEAFNKMETQLKNNGSFSIPTNMADALRLAADTEEERQRLAIENESMKPKALFADAVTVSHTTILIGELAKLIKQNGIDIGAQRLFEWLRVKGYLISRKGTDYNTPTQKSMNLSLFKVKETAINHSDGSVNISKTTKVTGKGQQYFINKFLNSEELVTQ